MFDSGRIFYCAYYNKCSKLPLWPSTHASARRQSALKSHLIILGVDRIFHFFVFYFEFYNSCVKLYRHCKLVVGVLRTLLGTCPTLGDADCCTSQWCFGSDWYGRRVKSARHSGTPGGSPECL